MSACLVHVCDDKKINDSWWIFHTHVNDIFQHPFYLVYIKLLWAGSVRMAERLALPTSDHGVAGSNPAGGEILPEPKRRFIAQSLSYSHFHRLEMTEILLKGRKTLTNPSSLYV